MDLKKKNTPGPNNSNNNNNSSSGMTTGRNNNDLQDYQNQLMLLEKQNKKRLEIARSTGNSDPNLMNASGMLLPGQNQQGQSQSQSQSQSHSQQHTPNQQPTPATFHPPAPGQFNQKPSPAPSNHSPALTNKPSPAMGHKKPKKETAKRVEKQVQLVKQHHLHHNLQVLALSKIFNNMFNHLPNKHILHLNKINVQHLILQV